MAEIVLVLGAAADELADALAPELGARVLRVRDLVEAAQDEDTALGAQVRRFLHERKLRLEGEESAKKRIAELEKALADAKRSAEEGLKSALEAQKRESDEALLKLKGRIAELEKELEALKNSKKHLETQVDNLQKALASKTQELAAAKGEHLNQ